MQEIMENQAIIATPNLFLRPLQLSDSEAMHAYRSLFEVARYQSFMPQNLQDTNNFITKLLNVQPNTPGTWFQMGIIHKASQQLIGDCGMHFPENEPEQAVMGITLSPDYQGKGYASETLSAMLQYLFKNLNKHRVYASVDPRNRASVAMLKRIGMRKEAHFRQSLWFKGEWADDLIYAILKDEWQAAHSGDSQQDW